MLPGDRSHHDRLARIIRVNQAGEFGAKCIYEGQKSVLKNTPSAAVIDEMYQQELVHLETFNRLMTQHRVRPTLLQPLWHVFGFALGAVTARCGEKVAMACTVAVEEVIHDHYADQIAYLRDHPDDQALEDIITQFQKEEDHHRELGLQHGAEEAPLYPIISGAIKRFTKSAIWLSERI